MLPGFTFLFLDVPQGYIKITFDDVYCIHLVRIYQKIAVANKIQSLKINFQNGHSLDVSLYFYKCIFFVT